MNEFIEYLTMKIETGKRDTASLAAEGRQDDADFSKVQTNIYDVCKTVTNALIGRPGYGKEAVKNRFEGFRASWSEALEKAKEHGDAKGVVVEETKLKVLEDVILHFSEVD